MPYGDYQSNFTYGRAAYGSFGGMFAAGSMPGPGYGGGFSGESPMGAPQGMDSLAGIGGQIAPASYMAPARTYIAPGGQYIQQSFGLMPSVNRMVGLVDPPRSVSAYEYRLNAATDAGERLGAGVAGAGMGVAAFGAGMAGSAVGGAAGTSMGAGIGAMVGSILPGIGTLVGAGIGATIGGITGNIGGYMAGEGIMGGALDLFSQQRAVRNFLEMSSFRTVGAGTEMADKRFGSGMSIRARRDITEAISQMDVEDSFVDMNDLNRMLQTAMGSGLMNNATTVDEFKRRFEEIKDTVKLVTRTLNTTIEEGMKTMQELRGVGITDMTRVQDITLQSDALGKLSGRTAQEMMTVGLQGAELFRGTGVSMEMGFQASQANLASIRAARDAGVLSQEAVAQAGGEEALAQRMTAGGLAFMQSAVGRGAMAAFAGVGMGFTGGGMGMTGPAAMGLNQGAFSQFIRNGMDLPSLIQQGAENLSDPASLIKFQANQERIMSEAGKSFGGEGAQLLMLRTAMTQAQFLQDRTGGELDMESALRYTFKGMGIPAPDIDTYVSRIKNSEDEFSKKQSALEATRRKEQFEQAYRAAPLTRWVESRIKDPLKSVGYAVANQFGQVADDIMEMSRDLNDYILGIEVADVSKFSYRDVMAATDETEMKEFVKTYGDVEDIAEMNQRSRVAGALSGTEALPEGYSTRNLLASGIQQADLSKGMFSMGGAIEDLLGKGRVRRAGARGRGFYGPDLGENRMRDGGVLTKNLGIDVTTDEDNMAVILDRDLIGSDTGLTYESARKLMTVGTRLGLEQDTLDRERSQKGFEQLSEQYFDKLTKFRGNFDSAKEVLTTLTGKKDLTEITQRELAAALDATEGSSVNKLIRREMGEVIRSGRDMYNNWSLAQMQGVQQDLEESKKKAAGILNVDVEDLSDEFLAKLVVQTTSKDPEEKASVKRDMIRDLTKAGLSHGEANRKLTNLLGTRSLTVDIVSDMQNLMTIQRSAGTSAMSNALINRMSSVEDDTSKKILGRISQGMTSADTFLKVMSGDEEDIRDALGSDLEYIQTNARILQESKEAIKEFRKEGTTAQRREELKKTIGTNVFSLTGDKGQVENLLKDIKTATPEALMDRMFTLSQSQKAMDVRGTGGGSEAGVANPQDRYSTQTSINQQILSALKQMNARLGGGG